MVYRLSIESLHSLYTEQGLDSIGQTDSASNADGGNGFPMYRAAPLNLQPFSPVAVSIGLTRTGSQNVHRGAKLNRFSTEVVSIVEQRVYRIFFFFFFFPPLSLPLLPLVTLERSFGEHQMRRENIIGDNGSVNICTPFICCPISRSLYGKQTDRLFDRESRGSCLTNILLIDTEISTVTAEFRAFRL